MVEQCFVKLFLIPVNHLHKKLRTNVKTRTKSKYLCLSQQNFKFSDISFLLFLLILTESAVLELTRSKLIM